MKKIRKEENEVFFFIFLPISKKKGIITFWPFDQGGGPKRRLRGLSLKKISKFTFGAFLVGGGGAWGRGGLYQKSASRQKKRQSQAGPHCVLIHIPSWYAIWKLIRIPSWSALCFDPYFQAIHIPTWSALFVRFAMFVRSALSLPPPNKNDPQCLLEWWSALQKYQWDPHC